MDITGTDPAAEIQVSDTTLTIRFHFETNEQAQEAARALVDAHSRGEAVTITLQNPVGDQAMGTLQ